MSSSCFLSIKGVWTVSCNETITELLCRPDSARSICSSVFVTSHSCYLKNGEKNKTVTLSVFRCWGCGHLVWVSLEFLQRNNDNRSADRPHVWTISWSVIVISLVIIRGCFHLLLDVFEEFFFCSCEGRRDEEGARVGVKVKGHFH